MSVGGRGKALRSSLRVTSALLGMINNSDSPTLLGEGNKYQPIPPHGRGKHLADTIPSRQAQEKAEVPSLRYLSTFREGSLGRGHTLPICLFCRPVTKPYVRHKQRNTRISGKQLLKAYLKKKSCIAKFREMIQKPPPLRHMHTSPARAPHTVNCLSWHFHFFSSFSTGFCICL